MCGWDILCDLATRKEDRELPRRVRRSCSIFLTVLPSETLRLEEIPGEKRGKFLFWRATSTTNTVSTPIRWQSRENKRLEEPSDRPSSFSTTDYQAVKLVFPFFPAPSPTFPHRCSVPRGFCNTNCESLLTSCLTWQNTTIVDNYYQRKSRNTGVLYRTQCLLEERFKTELGII